MSGVGPRVAVEVLLSARASSVRRLRGSGNEHWAVRVGDESWVLRCFGETHDAASIDWELRVVGFLAGRGWPVPAPVLEPVEIGERTWMLMDQLPGRIMRPSPQGSFERGRLLAALHRDLAALHVPQRPGTTTRVEGARLLPAVIDELPGALAERVPDRADELHRAMVGFMNEVLERLDNDHTPVEAVVVHGDLLPWNVLTSRGETTGLLDFEKSHLDEPANDVAFATWGGRYEADVVAGYAAESGVSFEQEDLRLQWDATCLFALHGHLYQRRLGNSVGGLGWALSHALQEWGT